MRVVFLLSFFLCWNFALGAEKEILVESREYCGIKFPKGSLLEVIKGNDQEILFCKFDTEDSEVTVAGLTGHRGKVSYNSLSYIFLTREYVGKNLKIPHKCQVHFKLKSSEIVQIYCNSEKEIIAFNDVKYIKNLSIHSSIYPTSGTLAEPATFLNFEWPAGTSISATSNSVSFRTGADVVFKGHKYIKGCRFHFSLPDGKVTDILGPNDHI